MLYKLGDALLGTMTNPFYVDLGFTKPEVATIVKGYGLVATLLGGFLGGVVVNRRGIVPALWICGAHPDGLEPGLRRCRPGSATIWPCSRSPSPSRTLPAAWGRPRSWPT